MLTDSSCRQLDPDVYLQPDDSSLYCLTLGKSAWTSVFFFSVRSDVPVLSSPLKGNSSCCSLKLPLSSSEQFWRGKYFLNSCAWLCFFFFCWRRKKKKTQLAACISSPSQHQLLFLLKEPKVIIWMHLLGFLSFVFRYYRNLIRVANV